jgi:UDP-3-O-[3-hydroxymyristoyl] N-acetylglucosamine deacetylase/3-hydroxyacyl-[acyl-carrier-protein] dehydratase
MFTKQHTIGKSVTVSGIGLHTGVEVSMTFHPAEENHGFVFCRTDMPGSPRVRADVDNVIDTLRGTTLSENGAQVHTVEHTLAALVGLQIDNVLIALDGPEPPVMDGSSAVYLAALKSAGIIEQEADREFFVLEEALHYAEPDRGVDIAALPQDDLRITVMVDYNSPVLGSQHATLVNIEDFEKEFAPSRTFCFLHELEMLVEKGLIRGGDLNNAIVIVDREIDEAQIKKLALLFNRDFITVAKEGILNNTELRFRNEPARHKLLDLLGDLALAGVVVKGQIIAARPGHAANVEFARKIKNLYKQQKIARKFKTGQSKNGVVFDINAIHNILPHRYPFLLVDKVTSFSEKHIEGIKNVTINEPFFVGHFEGNPIMPGVLQLEAMAQIGGILLLNTIDNPKNVWVYFLAIDNARFKKPVIPGDTLHFKLELKSIKRNICMLSGKAYVDGALVCEADLVSSFVKKDKP